MSYEQLRLEFNRQRFKTELQKKLGSKCINCESEVDVEYHHVVPLALGGTNKITNIVPLCHVCHQIAHGSKNIRVLRRSEHTGRKRLPPPNDYEKILNDYLHGFFGRRECEEKLGLSTGDKLTDKWYFKEYLEKYGIKKFKNKIDILSQKKCQNRDYSDKEMARIEYENGTTYIKLGNGEERYANKVI